MAIEFVGHAQVSGSGASLSLSLTSLTDGIGSAAQAGDLVVIFAGGGSSLGTTAIGIGATGYTSLFTPSARNDTYDATLAGFYKVMGTTPDTSATITNANTTFTISARAIVLRGANGGTITTGTTAGAANSGLPNPPSVTPTMAGSWVLSAGVTAHNQNTATHTSASFDGFLTQGYNGGTYDHTLSVGMLASWVSGAFDPPAFGLSVADNAQYSWVAQSVVIQPAPPPGVSVQPVAITAGNATLGAVGIGQRHALSAPAIATAAAIIGAVVLGQSHSLTPAPLVAQPATLSAPVLAGEPHHLGMIGLTGAAPQVAALSVGQRHATTPAGATAGAATIGQPDLSQVHGIGAVALDAAAPILPQPVIVQAHGLTIAGIAADPPVAPVAVIAQVQSLAPVAIAAHPALAGSVVLSQAHALPMIGLIAGGATLGALDVTAPEVGALIIAGVTTQPPLVASLSLSQWHALAPVIAEAEPAQIGAVSLAQVHGVLPAGIATAGADLPPVIIGQRHVLTPAAVLLAAPVLSPLALSGSAAGAPSVTVGGTWGRPVPSPGQWVAVAIINAGWGQSTPMPANWILPGAAPGEWRRNHEPV